MIIKAILFTILLLMPRQLKADEKTMTINEIAWMGTTVSSNDEWIELKNNTDGDIDLTGWKLEAADGSPKINLEGTITADGFFLLERTDDDSVPQAAADQIYTGSLSNSGEWLKLYDAEGRLIDEINAFGGWPGGDNGTKQTLERTNSGNWQTSIEPGGTPKAENSNVTEPPEEPPAEKPEEEQLVEEEPTSTEAIITAKKGDIVINEAYPNPFGADTDNEFIEIKNISNYDIDLTSWKITNAAKQEFIIPSLKMIPNSIVVFYRIQTNLALNNLKEKITLYSKSGKIINQLEYKSPAPEGQSYQRNDEGKLSWHEISPGKDNVFENEVLPMAVINGPKEAEVGQIIDFDASDSFDPEDRELSYAWTFGDGRITQGITARQIYLEAGTYEIILNVAASNTASTTEKFKIKITGPEKKEESVNQPTSTPITTEQLVILEEIPFIFISEFLPNPEGSDSEGEFIEIFSQHGSPVNLAGWQLDDAEGGSKPYTIPQGTIIKPGQYLAFWRTETKLALNNSDETVRLFAPDGTLVDIAEYKKSKEGVSFVLDENFSWQQTSTPTPDEINVLDEEVKNENEKEETESQPKVLGAVTKEIIEDEKPKSNKNKYLVSGISAITIIGLGAILKKRKLNNK